MPYCRYCLGEYDAKDMPSPRTCKLCREKQFKRGALKAKRRRGNRRSYEKGSVKYYFQRARIKHAPFPHDIPKLEAIFRRVLGINRYKKRFVSIDHIIPVNHPKVSGLTVSWNLQILTYEDNASKGNYCNLEQESRNLFNWLKNRGL